MRNTISFEGRLIEVDAGGYLIDSEDWSESLAKYICKNEGLEWNAEREEIITFVRSFYQEYETSPAIRMLVKALSNSFGPEKGNSRYLHRLFPNGPAKQVSKIAGLPKPAKCL